MGRRTERKPRWQGSGGTDPSVRPAHQRPALTPDNDSVQHIEFFTYTSARLWGIRIDGSDLRVHAADATRPLWL